MARVYPHLTGLPLADDCEEEAQVDILVAADQYWNRVTGRAAQGESGPTAVHTKLGWVLSGPVHCQIPSSSTAINLTSTYVLKCHVTDRPDTDKLDSELERFWRLESLEIVPNKSSASYHHGAYVVERIICGPCYPDSGVSRCHPGTTEHWHC